MEEIVSLDADGNIELYIKVYVPYYNIVKPLWVGRNLEYDI